MIHAAFARPAYLYLLEVEGRNTLKLGCSTNPKNRARALAAETRAPVRFLAVTPGTLADERELHARFSGYRKPGAHTEGHVKRRRGGPSPREWYYPAPEILRWAASLPEGQHGIGLRIVAKVGKPYRMKGLYPERVLSRPRVPLSEALSLVSSRAPEVCP